MLVQILKCLDEAEAFKCVPGGSNPEIKEKQPVIDSTTNNEDGESSSKNLMSSSKSVNARVSKSVNVTEGHSDEVMNSLVGACLKNDGAKKRQKKLKEGDLIETMKKEGRKLTSGSLVSCRIHSLNKPKF